MPDRKIAPHIYNATDFTLKLPAHERYTLRNGLPVYSINAGKEEVLSIEMVFLAGNTFENKNLVAATTNHLIKNGTAKKSAYELDHFFDYYGSFLSRKCFNETATITLHCLSKHAATLLPVMAELLTEATFPQSELEIYRKNAQQRLAVNLTKSDFVANRLIDTYIFGGNHPYGKYTTHEAFEALQREDLVNFYNAYYRHGNCILFVSGYLPNGLPAMLESCFGSLPFNIIPYKNLSFHYPLQPALQKKHIVVNDDKAVQGSIRIARQFPTCHAEDYTQAQVMNTLFGGYFGSRLMSNIREEKGYTYGIHSYIQNHISQTALVITTEAGKNVCEATIQEIWKEATILQQEMVDEDELQLVKNYLIGSILGELDGPFEIMNRWKNYILKNLADDYFYKSIESIKNTTPQQIQDAARLYLQEKDFWQLTVF